jgi:hypothetical protein
MEYIKYQALTITIMDLPLIHFTWQVDKSNIFFSHSVMEGHIASVIRGDMLIVRSTNNQNPRANTQATTVNPASILALICREYHKFDLDAC